MKVVLSILEILGWSLLVLLIVFLVLFILLLFCRLRYVAEGECLEEKWARFKAHWLFRLVRAKISYGDDLIYGEVHIFWKKITFSYDLSVKKEDAEDDAEEAVDDLETVSNESENQFEKKTSEIDKGSEENVLDSEKQVLEEQKRVEEKVIGTETSFELRGETEPWSNATDEESSKETSFNKDVFENEEGSDNARSESIISKIKGIIKRIKQIYLRLKKILTDEKNKDAVKHLKDEIVYLIKILLPKKSKIDAVFSTGSPDTTGQLFGVLACFPAMYQKNWKLIPDFQSDDLYFKGTFYCKGWIAAYQLVGIALRILFDKNCRRLYTMIKKFKNWLKKMINLRRRNKWIN